MHERCVLVSINWAAQTPVFSRFVPYARIAVTVLVLRYRTGRMGTQQTGRTWRESPEISLYLRTRPPDDLDVHKLRSCGLDVFKKRVRRFGERRRGRRRYANCAHDKR